MRRLFSISGVLVATACIVGTSGAEPPKSIATWGAGSAPKCAPLATPPSGCGEDPKAALTALANDVTERDLRSAGELRYHEIDESQVKSFLQDEYRAGFRVLQSGAATLVARARKNAPLQESLTYEELMMVAATAEYMADAIEEATRLDVQQRELNRHKGVHVRLRLSEADFSMLMRAQTLLRQRVQVHIDKALDRLRCLPTSPKCLTDPCHDAWAATHDLLPEMYAGYARHFLEKKRSGGDFGDEIVKDAIADLGLDIVLEKVVHLALHHLTTKTGPVTWVCKKGVEGVIKYWQDKKEEEVKEALFALDSLQNNIVPLANQTMKEPLDKLTYYKIRGTANELGTRLRDEKFRKHVEALHEIGVPVDEERIKTIETRLNQCIAKTQAYIDHCANPKAKIKLDVTYPGECSVRPADWCGLAGCTDHSCDRLGSR